MKYYIHKMLKGKVGLIALPMCYAPFFYNTTRKVVLSMMIAALMLWCNAQSELGNIAKLREAAENGDVGAQCELGRRFLDGIGVTQDSSAAYSWFARAANANSAYAQMMVAILHLQGNGTEYNENESTRWFLRAIQNGLEECLADPKNDVNPQRAFLLALMFNNITNTENTISWLRKSGESGYSIAQNTLGKIYLSDGPLVKKDLVKSTEWFRKAAEGGNAEGQFNLGYAYYDGIGIPQNYSEAIRWWRMSAAQGNTDSIKVLEQVECEIAETKKISNLAETGDVDAQLKLARCYETGKGVERSYQDAAKWYRSAAYGFKGNRYNADFWGFILWGFVVALTCKVLDGLWNRMQEAIEAAKRRKRFRCSFGVSPKKSCGDDEEEGPRIKGLSETEI